MCNQEEYAHLPPSQIYPKLLDKGVYIASPSTFYRVLKRNNQLTHRGRQKKAIKRKPPTTYTATGPNQVYTWDITYCKTQVQGMFYYLYMIVDIYSRKIVGYEVHECENGEYASALLERTYWREKILNKPLVLHSDNGAPMKSLTMKSKMESLNVTSSYNRPRVSNDNPYSESLFKTVKYHHSWPKEGFNSLSATRDWANEFVHWYNNEHQHSQIKYITPNERHEGKDRSILFQRKKVILAAKAAHPERWSGDIQNLKPVGNITLNPEKEAA